MRSGLRVLSNDTPANGQREVGQRGQKKPSPSMHS
jgi:hypothetical protein